MAASRNLAKVEDNCLSVFGHIAFSAKQWNLSENSKSQIAIRLEDVTESVKGLATDIEAFIKLKRGLLHK